jgi:hypothetical protein
VFKFLSRNSESDAYRRARSRQGLIHSVARARWLSGYSKGDRGKVLWDDIGIGALSSFVGSAVGGLFPGKNMPGSFLKGASESIAGNFTSGYLHGVAHGGYNRGQDFRLGLYTGLMGLPASAAGSYGDFKAGDKSHGVVSGSTDGTSDALFGDWMDKWIQKWSGVPDDNK